MAKDLFAGWGGVSTFQVTLPGSALRLHVLTSEEKVLLALRTHIGQHVAFTAEAGAAKDTDSRNIIACLKDKAAVASKALNDVHTSLGTARQLLMFTGKPDPGLVSAIVDNARLAVVELTLHYINDVDRALIHTAACATAAASGELDFGQVLRDAAYYHDWDSGAVGGSWSQSKKPRTRYHDVEDWASGKGRGKGSGGKGKGKTPGKGNGNGGFGNPGHYASNDQGFGQQYWDYGNQGGGKGWNGQDSWGWGPAADDGKGGKGGGGGKGWNEPDNWGGDDRGGKGSGKGGRGHGGNY
jgi:hypothetical protein